MLEPATKTGPLQESLSIVILGASGDLARKKLIPALFALYSQGLLPAQFRIFGFARQPMTDEGFRQRITERLTCRYVPENAPGGKTCAQYMDEFLARCFYVPGQYDSTDAFLTLYARLREQEGPEPANRMYYMAVPPFVFMDVARSLGNTGLVDCQSGAPWSRVVVEKPFGRDRASSDELVAEMGKVFLDTHVYRIDHYLGKEAIQNLLVLRFANLIFDPIWNRGCVQSVQISWKEDLGVEERGDYFDHYGIIRDVVQNHLTQILALVAMEPPISLDAHAIRNEKARVLSCVRPVGMDACVVGQYQGAEYNGEVRRGYTSEKNIAPDSRTPTYAAMVLYIDNRRWDGVPFYLCAGKGLDGRINEIRIRFRPVPGNIFQHRGAPLAPNELVIRIQPGEAIFFNIINKAPGLETRLVETALDLRYEAAFNVLIPDAYESLLLDVIQGDKSLFIRQDELAAAWDIYTPLLERLDALAVKPEPYPFGSAGPAKAFELARRHGVW